MTFDIRLLAPLLGLIFAPLLIGILQRVSCWIEGRRGAPLLQAYYELAKLLRKGMIESPGTTWLFQAGPIVSLASMITALFLVPLGNLRAPIWFFGDTILLVVLLAVGRFSMLLAMLDTGTPINAPRVNRGAWAFALFEPTLILGLTAVSRIASGRLSLSMIHDALTYSLWSQQGLVLILVAIAMAVIIVVDTSRIRQRELSQPSEFTFTSGIVMSEHSGPDLAFAQYALMLRLWLLGAVLLNLVLPSQTYSVVPNDFISITIDILGALGGIFLMLLVLGIVEATTARIRSPRILQLLIGATVIAALALALTIQPERPF